MIRHIILFFLIFTGIRGITQYTIIDSSRVLSYHDTIRLQKLKCVENKKNKAAAAHINSVLFKNLYTDYLAVEVDHLIESSGSSGEFNVLGARFEYQSKKTICISIKTEGCGAYCDNSTSYFNFEYNSGNEIIMDSVFTMEGLNLLKDSLRVYKKRIISDYLGLLRDTGSAIYKKGISDESSIQYKIDMYVECLEDDYEIYPSNFRINKTHLFFYSSRCSRHIDMAMDDLYEIELPIKIKDWKSYLTPYGKKILL